MEASSRIRVKMTFQNKLKAMVATRRDLRLSSMANLEKLIFESFPEVMERPTFQLDLHYEDEDGDLISIDNDGDLKDAIDWDRNNTFKFHIEYKEQGVLGSSPSTSSHQETRDRQPSLRSNSGGGRTSHGGTRRFPEDRPQHSYELSSGRSVNRTEMFRKSAAQHFSPVSNSFDARTWLRKQAYRSASQNIENMSSEEGIARLSSIVEERNLCNKDVNLLVIILAKDEFRLSLLRESTNKIYGVLMGSPFLLQLHGHIMSMIGTASAQDLMPYLLLTEELQSRTKDAWKQVPLDVLNNAIQKLDEGSAKSELVKVASRLLDHRDKLQRQAAILPSDETSLLGAEYLAIPIVPSQEELLQPHLTSDLPVNQVGMRYLNVSDYLETHFRLLREDYIHPLRQGIQSIRRQQMSRELRVYQEARIVGYVCGDEGVDYVMSLRVRKRTIVEGSKELKFGSLLCISADGFQKSFLFGVVSGKDFKSKGASKLTVWVRGLGTLSERCILEVDTTYVMVESTTAYFEAYYHVLRALQREEMEDIPFLKYLINLEPHVDPPSYLLRRPDMDRFDLQSVFPEMKTDLGTSRIHILQEWPQWCSTLDEAQRRALKHGLTKELSIIQGPPGTGKTFIGLLIVRLLLANLPPSGCDSAANGTGRKGPILVICVTNHALDQFLEGISKFEGKLIRIGGRSKCKALQCLTLKNLLEQQRDCRGMDSSHHRIRRDIRMEKRILELEVLATIDLMNSKYVGKNQLEGIAIEQQMTSLFPSGYDHTNIVGDWLQGAESPLTPSESCCLPEDNLYEQDQDTSRSQKSGMKVKMLVTESEDKDWIPVPRRRNRRRRGPRGIVMQESAHTVLMHNMANMTLGAEREIPPEGDDVEGKSDDDESSNSECAADLPPDVDVDNDSDDPRHELRGDPQVEAHDNELHLVDFIDIPNVWLLNVQQRRVLHDYWLDSIRLQIRQQFHQLTLEYERVCKKLREVEDEIRLALLRGASVVGLTTTGAAKNRNMLMSLNSEIIIVEEAAEVLEGHVLACLSSSVKHLVLIGDHMQLRPSTAVYKLSTEYKLDVSMFERLVHGGVEHVMLREQRRMRPSFSKLVKSLYPESVSKYEHIKGIGSDLWFFDHTAEEKEQAVHSSKVNTTEAKLVVELTLYLMKQECYSASDITILTMYAGQITEIEKLLKERVASRFSVMTLERLRNKEILTEIIEQEDGEVDQADSADGKVLIPQVRSVDDFQGEESDIIIVSLVRSNKTQSPEGEGTIGFLKTSNRICVALTRARKGMYIFGNATLLAERSTLWREVIKGMRANGVLDTKLELKCQNHPDTKTVISKEADFKQVLDGGCSRPCETQLDCGHVCPRLCHPGSHENVICPKPCPITYEDCKHSCTCRCHYGVSCPPCSEKVVKTFPTCDHFQEMLCHRHPNDEICRTPCVKVLTCGHRCHRVCGKPCTIDCTEPVRRTLECGHVAEMPCSVDLKSHSCEEPCRATLPDCEHECQGDCGRCANGEKHIPCEKKCGRILPCGHGCEARCSAPCPPCRKKCQKRCFHSACKRMCGEMCVPCMEPCAWSCDHHECELRCYEMCTRPRCDVPCSKILKCGHPCIGLCGDPCPKKCRTCDPTTVDVITLMTLQEYEETDRFVQLQDCKHLFEFSGLDTWMDTQDAPGDEERRSTVVQLKVCPECKSTIWRSTRYFNVVKARHKKIEDVKKRMYGYERARVGRMKLEGEDFLGALQEFQRALDENPTMMEAHLGAGLAYVSLRDYYNASQHLSFVVEKSSYAASVGIVLKRDKFFGTSEGDCSTPTDEVAIKAVLQLASLRILQSNFTEAGTLCSAVLQRHPNHGQANEIKRNVGAGVIQMVVQAMSREVGTRGHWYQCRNGHYYTIGECGGAMERSRCPDCKEEVGGGHHTLLPGNRHAVIDGSSEPAWPGI